MNITKNRRARGLLTALLCLLVYFAWRAAYTRLFLDEAFSYVGYSLNAELTVESFSKPSVYGLSAVVRVKGVKAVFYYDSLEMLKPGDKVTAHIKIEAAKDYYSGVHLAASDSGTGMKVHRADRPPLRYLPVYWAESIRSGINSILPEEPAALLRGILTGDKTGFSQSLSSDLSAAGMSHVAAVSGLHVSMLLGFIVLIFGNRRTAAWIGVPLIWLFVAVTGFSPSAVRAGIMITMTLVAPFLGREYSAVTALLAALFVLLLIDPYSVSDIGLQLSFLSTLGIILFSGKLRTWITGVLPGKIPLPVSRMLSSTLAASLSALVFTTPVIAYRFGSVSVIAPLANLLLLWMVNLIFITGALAVLISYIWWPAAYFAGYLPRLLLWAFRGGIGVLAKIPFARIFTTRPILVAWLVFVYGMILLMAFGLPRRRGIAITLAMLVVCAALDMVHSSLFSLEIAVLNVGQGECVVIRSGGKTAVVDCGGNLGNAGNIAADYLESVGVRRVDALILTHLDGDHFNGTQTLRDRVKVRETYISGYQDVNESDFTYVPVLLELTLELGEARLILVPSRWSGDGGENEKCMSVICIRDQFSFVTTGDLSASAERWLTRRIDLPSGGILMAGHHGSAGSSSDEFLGALKPQAAVVSVGKNSFGHPDTKTLKKLEASGCQIYRTDLDGHVIIKVP